MVFRGRFGPKFSCTSQFAMRALSCLILLATPMAWADTVVLGKLGQTVRKTTIHSAPNGRSRTYYRCKPYEYLIIRPSKYSSWLQVVLQNQAVGYIKLDDVARLPYDITLDQTAKTSSRNAELASRGVGGARSSLVGYSMKYIGTPYVWGGNDPNRGIDCSGFVKVLYGKIGIDLPRTAAEQATVGQRIDQLEDLQPGDRLYFWDRKRGKIGHTGMYMGNGFFIHSSTTNHGVATDDLRNPKWRNMLVAARR